MTQKIYFTLMTPTLRVQVTCQYCEIIIEIKKNTISEGFSTGIGLDIDSGSIKFILPTMTKL
jgi:hypothetical protein